MEEGYSEAWSSNLYRAVMILMDSRSLSSKPSFGKAGEVRSLPVLQSYELAISPVIWRGAEEPGVGGPLLTLGQRLQPQPGLWEPGLEGLRPRALCGHCRCPWTDLRPWGTPALQSAGQVQRSGTLRPHLLSEASQLEVRRACPREKQTLGSQSRPEPLGLHPRCRS